MQPWNTVKVGSPSKCVCVSGFRLTGKKSPFHQQPVPAACVGNPWRFGQCESSKIGYLPKLTRALGGSRMTCVIRCPPISSGKMIGFVLESVLPDVPANLAGATLGLGVYSLDHRRFTWSLPSVPRTSL